MDIIMIGISIEQADLALLGRVSFTDTAKLDMMNLLRERGIEAAVILSTCNRSEMYLSADAQKAAEAADLYRSFFHLPAEAQTDVLHGEAACRRLFEVCAGLRSLVPGEDQILAQVREALRFSQALGGMDKRLHLIFSRALSCARTIRSELRAGERPLSLAALGIQFLRQKTVLAERSILILGAGKMAQLILAYLDDSAARVSLACRSKAQAHALCEAHPNLRVISFDARAKLVRSADIVIGATSAPHLVVHAADLEAGKTQFFLDLASPCDLDPAIATMAGKTLIDLEMLKQASSVNEARRRQLMCQASAYIEPALQRCMQELSLVVLDPAYASMQERCEQICAQSYDFLLHRLSLDERERHILRKTLRASLFRLMQEPFQAMKQLAPQEQESCAEMLQKLFGGERR